MTRTARGWQLQDVRTITKIIPGRAAVNYKQGWPPRSGQKLALPSRVTLFRLLSSHCLKDEVANSCRFPGPCGAHPCRAYIR
jgi:hypothetical protein